MSAMYRAVSRWHPRPLLTVAGYIVVLVVGMAVALAGLWWLA